MRRSTETARRHLSVVGLRSGTSVLPAGQQNGRSRSPGTGGIAPLRKLPQRSIAVTRRSSSAVMPSQELMGLSRIQWSLYLAHAPPQPEWYGASSTGCPRTPPRPHQHSPVSSRRLLEAISSPLLWAMPCHYRLPSKDIFLDILDQCAARADTGPSSTTGPDRAHCPATAPTVPRPTPHPRRRPRQPASKLLQLP